MSTDVLVPDLPESVADATLIAWHKKEGDKVSKYENLADLETDKVVLEVTAPQSGILGKILKKDGAVVNTGEVLAVIEAQAETEEGPKETDSEKEAPPLTPSQETATSDIPLSPSVRRLIHEKSLKPSEISGSGKSGRITKADVLDHLKKQEPELEQPEFEEAEEEKQPEPKPSVSNLRPEQRVAMTRLRAKVAEYRICIIHIANH